MDTYSGPRDEVKLEGVKKAPARPTSPSSIHSYLPMATPKQLQKLTRDDVTKHNKDDDLVRIPSSPLKFQSSPEFHPLSVDHH
jgi:hypothetical protein